MREGQGLEMENSLESTWHGPSQPVEDSSLGRKSSGSTCEPRQRKLSGITGKEAERIINEREGKEKRVQWRKERLEVREDGKMIGFRFDVSFQLVAKLKMTPATLKFVLF